MDTRTRVNGLALLFHPLAMNSFRHWRALLAESGGVDDRHRMRTAAITAISPLWKPLRWFERAKYEHLVAQTPVTEPPLFIIGHWRTGTTLLHYLLSQDPHFGNVSLLQTLVPGSFLAGRRILPPLMGRFVADKRPMDNMPLALDLPQEEEYALCNFSPCSLYVGWYFPKRMPELFRKYVLFEDVPETTVDAWKTAYLDVLKKATYHWDGRPLVLKNPPNTARIRVLLDLFPKARFLHVYRDPYVVYKSTQRLHRAALDLVGLQDVTGEEIRENVLHLFKGLVQRYFDERDLIPQGQLAEVRFEDLEQRPVEEMERVYAELSLPGWDNAKPRFESHMASQRGYQKNNHALTPEDLARVEEEWAFAIDQWGYDRPPLA